MCTCLILGFPKIYGKWYSKKGYPNIKIKKPPNKVLWIWICPNPQISWNLGISHSILEKKTVTSYGCLNAPQAPCRVRWLFRTKETQRGSLSDQPKQGTIVRRIPQICKTCASSLIPPKWVPCNDSCTMSRYLIEWFMTLEDPVYKEWNNKKRFNVLLSPVLKGPNQATILI